DDAPWPPDDVSPMLVEMRSDPMSPHWQRVRLLVHAFARRFGERSNTYLDDADDLTQQVMEILVTPGKLETFGHVSAAGSAGADGARPLLRKAFLAWIAIVTRHAWQNRARYYRARPDLALRDNVVPGVGMGSVQMGAGGEEAPWEPPDLRASV